MDVEFSKHVEDDSVAYIKRLKGLVKVNVFRTSLSMEGQVIEFEFSKYKSQILRSKNSFDPYPSQAFWIIDYELYINKFHLVAQKNYCQRRTWGSKYNLNCVTCLKAIIYFWFFSNNSSWDLIIICTCYFQKS